jgi:DNA-binding CsgD family transcriptional regulator
MGGGLTAGARLLGIRPYDRVGFGRSVLDSLWGRDEETRGFLMDGRIARGESGGCCCDRPHLTERELQVLQLIAEGYTNKDAAKALNISVHTVARQMTSMLRRAGAANRAALVTRAFQGGILRLDGGIPELTGRRCLKTSW